MLKCHHPAVLALGLLTAFGPLACAQDGYDAADGTTSVAVLDGDDGVLGSNQGSGNGNAQVGNGNSQAGNGNAQGANLPPYPSRDAALYSKSDSAWQTFMSTHWGNTDWVGTTYDYAHIMDALAVNIEVNSGRRYVPLAETLYLRIAAGNYGYVNTDTLDTPAFMALGLARLYNVTANRAQALPHRAQWLTMAQNYLSPVLAAEGTDSNNQSMGLYIDGAHSSRRTSVNGAAVLAALEVYKASGDATLLTTAKRIYDAWSKLAVSSTFTVADGLTNGGQLDPPLYTYTYGLMVGCAVALHSATGEAQYLTQARGMAAVLARTMSSNSAAGAVLIEPQCTSAACGLALLYRGISLRALAQLAAVDGNNTVVQGLLNGTAAAIFKSRSASDGHWPVNWTSQDSSTQDPASDLAVAMGLGYLALSAPQQVKASPSGLTALAAEGAMALDLPVLPGGDATGGWATVGPFTATSQSLILSLLSPLSGPGLLTLRYSVPDGSSPSLKVALSPDGSNTTVALRSTGSATSMATTTAVPLTLAKGLNTVTLTAPAVPNTVQLDTAVAVFAQNSSGSTCVPPAALQPLAPVAGDRVCGLPTFTWKGGSGSARQSEVYVDGALACSVQGSAQSCVATQALSSGRHSWQVVEDGCGMSPVQAFDVSQRKPQAIKATSAVQGTNTVLSWPQGTDAQVVDVILGGQVVCGQLKGLSCALPTATLGAAGQNTITFQASNSCGLTSSTLTL